MLESIVACSRSAGIADLSFDHSTLLREPFGLPVRPDRLTIGLETVRTHIRHTYEKLEVRSRTEATVKYLGGPGAG